MRSPLVAATIVLAGVAFARVARADEPPPSPLPAPAEGPASPSAPRPRVALEVTTLKELLDQGVISKLEFDAALRDLGESTGDKGTAGATSLAFGRWATTIYGFAEGDAIYDSTQGLNDLAGNAQIARSTPAAPPASPQTYAANNAQSQFSVRNSRFGVRLKPPGNESVRSSGLLEMDFLGAQSLGYGAGQAGQAGQVSESTYFTSPLMRIRHAMFRVETPVVDVLVGQYWHLFGWQGTYFPNTVEIQGLPGELYARTPQVRLSKTIHANPVTLEIAAGVMRPPSRGSVTPEVEGGVRLAVDTWTGMQTQGATGTAIAPASIALTGDWRNFEVPAIDSLVPTQTVKTSSTSVAADFFLPILPAREGKRDNALSVSGEIVYGGGIADLYTGLSGGMQFPAIPNINGVTNPQGLNPAPTWPQNIDNGLVNYDITPGGFALHPIQWTTYLLGLQYYLPKLDGRVWISANFSRTQSTDSTFLGNYSSTVDFVRQGGIPSQVYYFQTNAGQVRSSEEWWDVNLFAEPIPAVRVGAEFAQFIDRYADDFTANDTRVQFSGFFIF